MTQPVILKGYKQYFQMVDLSHLIGLLVIVCFQS